MSLKNCYNFEDFRKLAKRKLPSPPVCAVKPSLNSAAPFTSLVCWKPLAKALVSNPPNSIRDGGVIAEGYNQELDDLRSLSQDDSKFLADFEQQEIISKVFK